MDTKSIIELLSGIGACLAAVAAFLTIRQLSKQHKQSYRPDLAFNRTNFYGYARDTESKKSFPTYWFDKKMQKEEIKEPHQQFGLFIYNVGLGVAKGLNVKWDFPLETFVEDINSIAQRRILQFYLDYKNGVIDFKSNDFAQSIYLWRNQKNDIVDYVLPSHVSHDGKFLQIPSAYLFLISVYIYASMKSENLSKFNIPEITATLSYNDIGGDDHEETFAFYPHIIMIGAEEFRGYFDINKKLMKK